MLKFPIIGISGRKKEDLDKLEYHHMEWMNYLKILITDINWYLKKLIKEDRLNQ